MPAAERYGIYKAKGILFGDDYWGTILDEEAPYKNKKGIMMKRYLIVPSSALIKAYPILQKPGMLTYKNYALWVEYPMYFIADENPSRTNAIAHIFCSFDGKETPMTRRLNRYTNEIRMLEHENENLKLSNMQLLDENKHLLGEVLEIVGKIKDIDEVVKSGGKKSDEEGYPEGENE